ncbi:MAG: hypothetical protein GF365_04720 [Candidatus Buchananbacteria bacterium]|nr:hypothetical protein [Candidatus Buchananbacteria bacterium]
MCNKDKSDYYIIDYSTIIIVPLINGRELVVPKESFLFELLNKKGGISNGSRKSQQRP